jgi:hypothetical protein
MESFGSKANLDNMAYYGNSPEDYQEQYVVDHGNDSVAWSLWMNTLDKINTLPPRVAYVDSVSKYFDYSSFFGFNAVLDYNLNAEPKNRNGIYYFDQNQKKWFTICWDQNVSFPDFGDPGRNRFPDTQMTAMLDKYSTYPQFSETYNKTLCQLSNGIFGDSEVSSKIIEYRKLLDAPVEKDWRKNFTYKQYEISLNNLREFIQLRNKEALVFLERMNYSCSLSNSLDVDGDIGILVFPIPATNDLNVVDNSICGFRFEISNLQGIIVLTSDITPSKIDISTLIPGVYFLRLTKENRTVFMQKIVKMQE